MSRIQIPEGVTDFYGDIAYRKRKCEAALRESFFLSGFDEVQTPTVEYYDTFRGEIGEIREEATIRFFDQDGRMLALRPDLTLPVVRLAAARAIDTKEVHRFFYIGDLYGTQQEYGMKRRQVTQAGCELFGIGGVGTDAEILITAIRSMLVLGLKDLVIDVGHVGFVRAVCKDLNIPEEFIPTMMKQIDEKNETALLAFCEKQGIGADVIKQLVNLIYLFGSADVLDQAKEIYRIPECQIILRHLDEVIAIIRSLQFPVRISVDLGMAPNIHYYTGMVFRGLSPLFGSSILSGGRYDQLMEQFGVPMEATGFALGVENILYLLEQQGVTMFSRPPLQYLVGGCPVDLVYQRIQSYMDQGYRTGISYQTTLDAFREEMVRQGVERGLFLDGKKELSVEKGGAIHG